MKNHESGAEQPDETGIGGWASVQEVKFAGAHREKAEEIPLEDADREAKQRHPNALGEMPEGYLDRVQISPDYQANSLKMPEYHQEPQRYEGRIAPHTQREIDHLTRQIKRGIEQDVDGSAYEYFRLRIEQTVLECSPYVRAAFEARKQAKYANEYRQRIEETKDQLSSYPGITLPFTKAGREKRQIKKTLKSLRHGLHKTERYIESLNIKNPDKQGAEDDRATLRAIDHLQSKTEPFEMRKNEEDITKYRQYQEWYVQQLSIPQSERQPIAASDGEEPRQQNDSFYQEQIIIYQRNIDYLEERVAAYTYENPNYHPKIDISRGLASVNKYRSMLNQEIRSA